MPHNTSFSREPAGDREPIRLIYIMGAVRSGSTLWDTILGNHPDVESVGELCNVSENGWVSSRMCACGQTATQCPFWSEIRREWARLTGTDDEAGYGALVRSLEKHRLWLPRLETEARNGSARVREYSERTKALYEAIRTVSGKSVLVDSSKRPSRALLLSKIPGIDMTLVHLVRDARGVAWSEQKRLKNAVQAGLPKNYGVKSVGHTAMLWAFVNLQASWMRGRLPAWKSIRLRYEDSIARPHEALERIGSLADVDYREVAQAIAAAQPLDIGHTIAGNKHADGRCRPVASRHPMDREPLVVGSQAVLGDCRRYAAALRLWTTARGVRGPRTTRGHRPAARRAVATAGGVGLSGVTAAAAGVRPAGASVMCPLSLRRNFVWAAAGNAVSVFSQWGKVVVLAHLGNLEMIGLMALAFAICGPVIALAGLGLRSAVVTDVRREYSFADYLTLRLLTSLLALAVIVGMVLIGDHGRATAAIIVVVAVAEVFVSISDVFHGLMQHYERMDRMGFSLMIRGPLMLGLLGLGVLLTGDVFWAMVGYAAAMGLTLLLLDLPMAAGLVRRDPLGNRLLPRWRPRSLVRLAVLAAPLGVVLALAALAVSLPRYTISHYLGNHALGVFVSIYYLSIAGTKLVNTVGQSAGPRLAKFHAAADARSFGRLLGQLVMLVLGLGAAGVLAVALLGQWVLGTLYDADFRPFWGLSLLVMTAAAAMYLSALLGMAIESMRRFRTHMAIRAVGVLLLLATLPVLVPAFGLYGAAVSMLISSVANALGCCGVILWALTRPKSRGRRACCTAGPPVKVLHVLGRMDRGGAEMRTVELLRRADCRQYEFHFCVLSGLPGELDDEIQSLGGRLHYLDRGSWAFAWRFCSLLRRDRFDVVHCQVLYYSGWILRLAAWCNTPVRVVQLHNTHDGRVSSWRRRAYRAWMRRWIDRCATHIVAVSDGVMSSIWGPDWPTDPRCQVVYNGVETAPFDAVIDPITVREEFGVPRDAPLCIHVGSFTRQKNHLRLSAIFAELLRCQPAARLLLVGAGEVTIQRAVERRIDELGLSHRVVMCGRRADVPRLLQAADVMILPSRWEGLPGVVQEAALAGLPVVASDLPGVREIATELDGIRTVALESSDAQWAEAIEAALLVPRDRFTRQRARTRFAASEFTLERCLERNCAIWQNP